MTGFLVRCVHCRRQERTGPTPLRDGFPKCCDTTMRLVDVGEFVARIHEQTAACFEMTPTEIEALLESAA